MIINIIISSKLYRIRVNKYLLMLQHPLPSNCRFYVESYPPTLDINSHLQILCFTNATKERTINYKIDWRKRINGVYVPVTSVQGNSYTCTSADIGAYINAEITSLDPIYSGTTVLEFGPVNSPLPMASLSTGIAGLFQSGNIQPQLNNPGGFGFPSMPQSLPNLLSQAAQNYVPFENVPPVNSHTVFLLGNGGERQCDLKFTEHGMRIKDILTDYCYKFKVNRKGPRFEQSVSDPTRVQVTFDHKYVGDLSKFLRSFDDNRFLMKMGDRGSGIIDMRFPAKQRKQTFMEAYQSIIVDDATKERTETAEALFKTSIYNPIKTNVVIEQQEYMRGTKATNNKISMTNYSGAMKETVKKGKYDDYTQGSLLTWMDNILHKDQVNHAKHQTSNQVNQLRLQSEAVGKQFDFERNRSIQRQRQRVIQVEEAEQRRMSNETNNLINMSLVLNELKRQNEQLMRQNQRLLNQNTTKAYNHEAFDKQISVKQGVIADAYSQLSLREESISKLQFQYEKLSALFRQSEKKADGYMIELSELRLSNEKYTQFSNKQLQELRQKVFVLTSKNQEYEEQVTSFNQNINNLNEQKTLQSEKQIQQYVSQIQSLENKIIFQLQQIQRLKSHQQVSHTQTQSILRAQIMELKYRLDEQLNQQSLLKTSTHGSVELSKAKATILELQTNLRHQQAQIQAQTPLTQTQTQTMAHFERLLREKQNEILNLQAEIETHRMHEASRVEGDTQPTDYKKLKHQYQSLTNIRNMLQHRLESLLLENHELQTLIQKLDFEIKYLQENRHDPEIEDYKTQIEKMSNHIDDQEQQHSRLANEFENFKLITNQKEEQYLNQIIELSEKFKKSGENSFENQNYLPGNIETFRRQNSMLVEENQKLLRHCQRLTQQTRDIPKLRGELIELRRKLITATEQQHHTSVLSVKQQQKSGVRQIRQIRQIKGGSSIRQLKDGSMTESLGNKYAVSEILRN